MPQTREIIWISSHVADGRVGNRAGVFALERLGVPVVEVPTVLLPAVPGPDAPPGGPVPRDLFEKLIAGLFTCGAFARAAKLHIGYIGEPSQAACLAAAIDRARGANPALRISLDPILGDHGALYVPEATARAMAEDLVPRADLLFPNRFELEYLSGHGVTGAASAVAAARALKRPHVIVTSVPADTGDELLTLSVRGRAAFAVRSARLAAAPHGTGDLLSALYLAHLHQETDENQALLQAVNSVHGLILCANAERSDRLPMVMHQQLMLEPDAHAQLDELV